MTQPWDLWSYRLEKKYALEIPYDKVFRGKEKALDMIFGK